MSFWIYGNKCLFASSGKEKIAFTVHSKEFCEMMMLMWKDLWKNALK
jgi:AAA15 family ATPase/GTPase